MNKIPKKLHHIWIGPYDPPLKWMQTWRDKHPDWEYTLWDNWRVFKYGWMNQKHMEDMYMSKRYSGVADLLRYEILLYEGGFVAPADAVCLRNIEELFDDGYAAYSAYENEKVRPGLIMPLLASEPSGNFARILVSRLNDLESVEGEAWQVTGNKLMQDMYEMYQPEDVKILPSITFVPDHYTGEKGQGDLPTYATHEWGTTKNNYPKS